MLPPIHNSSSTDQPVPATPPSEISFEDDQLIQNVISPTFHRVHYHDEIDSQVDALDGEFARNYQAHGPINTDYESSAAEDGETFSTGKYETAEYAFLSYSRTNKIEKLQTLLNAKLRNELDLNLNFKGQQKQNFSWSALHLACYFGHAKVVETLLSRRQFREEIDINIQNNTGDTPLHKAALTNRANLVQLLLSHRASVFIKNCDGLLPRELTNDRHILGMLEAAEQADKNRTKRQMFEAVDNGDLTKLQEHFRNYATELDIVDERGNSLLHLAAMRGFKAICIFLLEQGLDPYKKNNLGQTCVDLSSYQLRQLFANVKPADNQLRRLSNQKVSRFEGPLLKKVRILGWRQIYVVVENGVILLFNNRRDSMNKSRRGYKYLESAICEPDSEQLGMFTLLFSDKSKAVFLVTNEHLSSYTSFRNPSATSQIELVRQKWIDSIRDHIRYSTQFIRSGLKLNDTDEAEDGDGTDLATLNHLLPMDTIKSFIHEARAHYSILERHAESLCNLVQAISSPARLSESREDEIQSSGRARESSSNAGGRLLGFIMPSKQTDGNQSVDDNSTAKGQQVMAKLRSNNLTNEFFRDDWHCLLFHLRLLVESTENTKVSMGQALALMDHQEQLRQNRIQDQDERCRVLEDSLHALARDHHELEKSISQSQLNHLVSARSITMSTDLNEYFDAFEDFDDEKTMTPNSMPSDDDLETDIDEAAETKKATGSTMSAGQQGIKLANQVQAIREGQVGEPVSEEDSSGEEEDLQSNCSALTVGTISEIHSLVATNQDQSDSQFNTLRSDRPQKQSHR